MFKMDFDTEVNTILRKPNFKIFLIKLKHYFISVSSNTKEEYSSISTTWIRSANFHLMNILKYIQSQQEWKATIGNKR